MKSITSIRNVCSAEQNSTTPGGVIITAYYDFAFVGYGLYRAEVIGVNVIQRSAFHHSSQSCRGVNIVGLSGISKSINIFFVSAKIIAGCSPRQTSPLGEA